MNGPEATAMAEKKMKYCKKVKFKAKIRYNTYIYISD